MGEKGFVPETCRQQGECQPDMSAMNSYFWLLRTRTPGLLHDKKKEINKVEGMKTL